MTWYPDLGQSTMVADGEHVRAIGWLSPRHAFTKGEVPAEFLSRLQDFAKDCFESTEALGWGIFLGVHCCDFCGQSMAGGNFGVPQGEVLFVCPEMLPHYIEAHGYRPPDEFIAAVLASPLPATAEYGTLVEPFRRLHERAEAEGARLTSEDAAEDDDD